MFDKKLSGSWLIPSRKRLLELLHAEDIPSALRRLAGQDNGDYLLLEAVALIAAEAYEEGWRERGSASTEP